MQLTPHRQSSLFDAPETAPYQAHSPTSKAAAESIAEDASVLRGRVLAYLKKHGPSTDEEMQIRIPMAQNTQRPRRRELVLRGVIRDSGQKRLTQSGMKATLWEVV